MKLFAGLSVACFLAAGSMSAHAFPGKDGTPVLHLQRSMSGVVRNQEFHNRKFTGWGLYNTRFENCELTRTNFEGIEGRGARFTNTDFVDVSFATAHLQETWFLGGEKYARMTRVSFSATKAPGVRFETVALSNSDLENVQMVGGLFEDVRMSNSRLSGAHLTAARLSDVSLVNMVAVNIDFSSANLTDVRLSNSNMSGSVFVGTRLKDVRFINTNLHSSDFRDSSMFDVTFTNVTGLTADAFARACGSDVTGLPNGVTLPPCR